MNRDNQPWRPLQTADLEWRADDAPVSRRHGDIYFSSANGIAESRYVFLDGNGLAQRFARLNDQRFCVGELGFGTGLNFLLTWQHFRRHAPARARLHYWATECHPLQRADFARCSRSWTELAPLASALGDQWPLPVHGMHRLEFDSGRVTLDLCHAEVAAALADLAGYNVGIADAWYLDGFAPARNPEMWRDDLWPQLARASRPGATVSTFSAAGSVRRGLQAAGFTVGKRPGFGAKRECLQGELTAAPGPHPPDRTPWDLPQSTTPTRPRSAVVLGAGLAGAMTAAQLARRGLAVTVLDRAEVAGRASGNAQGILYTRLSHRHSALADFALLGFLYAHRHYARMFGAGELHPGRDGDLGGCFLMAGANMRLEQLTSALADIPELAVALDAASAAEHLGVAPAGPGLWLPYSGWLSPPAVCRALLRRQNIAVHTQCGAVTLTARDAGWLAQPQNGEAVHADIAVVAAGILSAETAELNWLPLRPIRGQTTQVPAAALPGQLRAAFCHSGYIAPAMNGEHCIGATFTPGEYAGAPRGSDNRENLDALAAALPAWESALNRLEHPGLAARSETRCASPDYLPMVGAVPDAALFRNLYGGLRRNARRIIAQRGPYLRGLYVNTAHGSRGLSSAPIAAEIIASAACGEPPPLSRYLIRALAPGRFILRDLKRAEPA